MSFWFDLDSQYQAAFEKWWFLQCCSSFRGSSSIWGARAPRVVKMASQLGILSSLAYQADSSSPFIHQTWIFCKENGSKRSFLPEIEVQTFWYTLYAVTTACCVPWQIPKEIWKNTAGKSARGSLTKSICENFSPFFQQIWFLDTQNRLCVIVERLRKCIFQTLFAISFWQTQASMLHASIDAAYI